MDRAEWPKKQRTENTKKPAFSIDISFVLLKSCRGIIRTTTFESSANDVSIFLRNRGWNDKIVALEKTI